MFERYTEKARRTIFFARYEASQFGSPSIEAEHLLLGLLSEDRALSVRFFLGSTSPEALREQIARHSLPREQISTSADLPLSNESKHVLAYAAEEAERLHHHFIGSEHLLLGLLREQHSFAAELLSQHGISLELVHKYVQDNPPVQSQQHTTVGQTTMLGNFRLALKVVDLEASLAFYTRLGFVQVEGSHEVGEVVLANGPCRLALHQGHTAENQLIFRGGNIANIAARLEAAGISFEKPPSTAPDGRTIALFRDPDGNAIYLVSHPDEPRRS